MMVLKIKSTLLFKRKKIIQPIYLLEIMVLEKNLQAKIIKRLTQEGWLCVKLIKTNLNGIPDLMCLKDGQTIFIEVKRATGVLSELQKIRINQLKEKGFEVKIWTDYGKDYSARI